MVNLIGARSGVLDGSAFAYLGTRPAPGTVKPKAYLNWVLLDEQLKFVNDANSGAIQVTNDGQLNTHGFTDKPITRNGYLYIYVSNETPNIDVYFDNLQVKHTRGPIVEENHYYPFGLTMAGISSRSLGKVENKYKFNGGNELQNKEFNDGSGLDWYDAIFRVFDPQIGRLHQADPLSEITCNWSPYAFALNNPILFNDPLGLAARDTGTEQVDLPEIIIVGRRVPQKPVLPYSNVHIPRPQIIPFLGTPSYPADPSGSNNTSKAGLLLMGIRTGVTTGATAVGTSISGGTALTIVFVAGVGYILLDQLMNVRTGPGYPANIVLDNTYIRGPIAIAPPQPYSIPTPVAIPPGQSTHVYEIGGWDSFRMEWVTLKYGVASTAYDTYGGAGNRRPDGQLGGAEGDRLRAKYPHLIIKQFTIATLASKPEAHIFENNLVWWYRFRNIRPDPTNPLFGLKPPEQDLPHGSTLK